MSADIIKQILSWIIEGLTMAAISGKLHDLGVEFTQDELKKAYLAGYAKIKEEQKHGK